MLNIQLQKENSGSNRLLVQKHTKIKDVTWWLLVGDSANNLLSVKKLSVKKKVQLKLQVELP